MNYNDIKNIIWFKNGMRDNDKLDIEQCIFSMREDLAVESVNFNFIKKYGSIVLCEAFHQYYKNNKIVFFVNHNLITNLIAMNNRSSNNNKSEIERIFKVEMLSSNPKLNLEKNVELIKDRAKNSEFFNKVDIYDFLKSEIGDEMIERKIFLDIMKLMNKIVRKNLDIIVEKISHREQFTKYSELEKKEIIETMVYYSYINEIIFSTNNLRNKFLGNIVIDDFIKNPRFREYINLLLINSKENNMLNIFQKAPTGEDLEKQIIKDPRKTNSMDLDLTEYNNAAIAHLNNKYKKANLLVKVKKWFKFKNILT